MVIKNYVILLGLALSSLAHSPSWAKGYGTDNPTFLPPFSVTDYSEISTGSSPDNSFALLTALINSSQKEIRLAAYLLRSPGIGEALEKAAKRGVKVSILLDGWTVAKPKLKKVDSLELYLAMKIVQAGGRVFYLRSDSGNRKDRRFRYLHAKYAVVDDSLFLGSENFANSGFSPTTTFGNRGWVISIQNPTFAAHFKKMFDSDLAPVRKFNDIVAYGEHPDYTLRDKNFVPDSEEKSGSYLPNRGTINRGNFRLERVLSPDDALSPTRAILGAIKNAEESLKIQSLSFPAHWGKNEDSPQTHPNPIAEEVLAAARRGLKVRVMLNPPFSFWSHPAPPEKRPGKEVDLDEPDKESLEIWQSVASGWEDLALLRLPFVNAATLTKPRKIDTRDNKALIKYFRDTAKSENLDLQASFFYVKEDSLKTLHNKGMIVDDKKTLVSSINWTENSLKNNREAAVIIESPDVAKFYSDIFEVDWAEFRSTK